MTKGRLGAIVCPMLEDELIYNVESDPEEKRVYLVRTPYIESIIPKLEQHNVTYDLVSQKQALSNELSDGYSIYIWMMSIGLHEDLDIMRMEIMNQIVTIHRSVDTILLYYGRCGRSLDNICSWASASVPIPVEIFRNKDGTICDDCICVPIGGTEKYLKLLRTYPGKIYLTPAVAGNFENFMSSMELFNGLDTSNSEIMKMLLDMAGYTEALAIQTGLGDQKGFHKNVEDFARRYNLIWKKLEDGWVSREITDANYDNAKKTMVEWLKKGVRR